MYSREEARRLREDFWTAFGQYMRAVPSADGERVSWLNYKTGIKHLYFRMDVDNNVARIGIDIRHPDSGIRSLIFAQFLELQTVFGHTVGNDWIWEEQAMEQGRELACIYTELQKVTVFRKEDWPTLISFFKPRIIALDEFWSLTKHHFEIFR